MQVSVAATMDEGTLTPPLNPDSGSQLSVSLGHGLTLTNPVMPASGCFGPQLGALIPVSRLGAVVSKTVFSQVRSGNPAHRLAETADGMLNAVGIPSPGTAIFLAEVLPAYQRTGAPVVVSIGGLTVSDYWQVTEELADADYAALEVNVSCPNLEHGGLEIGADPGHLADVVHGVVARTDRPVIVKLTPNVTDITELARAAESAGAHALTVCNTFVGLKIDLVTRRPALGNGTGGLSGAAIKPLALNLVWRTARSVSIPVIGCGGITTVEDVVEFLLAGASAVQIGTANFTRPDTMIQLIDQLPAQLTRMSAHQVADLVGALQG